jgi:transcriptional antiterminator NusG
VNSNSPDSRQSPIPSPQSLVGEQWFAVWTRSRHEQVVRDQLERKRIDAFLPTITRWSIVSFEGKPAPIPEYELESIRVLVGSELQYDPCPLIHEGMMVEVVHGPLKGVVGRLMRKDAAKARLVLSVDLIGQAVSVEVDAADVKPY